MARPDIRIVSIGLARVSPETRALLHTVARNATDRRGRDVDLGIAVRSGWQCAAANKKTPD